jgi:hypothetical protein
MTERTFAARLGQRPAAGKANATPSFEKSPQDEGPVGGFVMGILESSTEFQDSMAILTDNLAGFGSSCKRLESALLLGRFFDRECFRARAERRRW